MEPNRPQVLMITERNCPKLVEEQVKAVSNLKIDSVTVWDSGKGKDGKGARPSSFPASSASCRLLQELTKNVGLQLPDFLGKPAESTSDTPPRHCLSPGTAPEKPRRGNRIGNQQLAALQDMYSFAFLDRGSPRGRLPRIFAFVGPP